MKSFLTDDQVTAQDTLNASILLRPPTSSKRFWVSTSKTRKFTPVSKNSFDDQLSFVFNIFLANANACSREVTSPVAWASRIASKSSPITGPGDRRHSAIRSSPFTKGGG